MDGQRHVSIKYEVEMLSNFNQGRDLNLSTLRKTLFCKIFWRRPERDWYGKRYSVP